MLGKNSSTEPHYQPFKISFESVYQSYKHKYASFRPLYLIKTILEAHGSLFLVCWINSYSTQKRNQPFHTLKMSQLLYRMCVCARMCACVHTCVHAHSGQPATTDILSTITVLAFFSYKWNHTLQTFVSDILLKIIFRFIHCAYQLSIFFHFWRQGLTVQPWLAKNTLRQSRLTLNLQRSAHLCLPSSRVKGVSHSSGKVQPRLAWDA